MTSDGNQMTPYGAGPLNQPVPNTLMCERCETKMAQRGGYLMGGWSDWVAFQCPTCETLLYWRPDRNEVP